MRLANWPLNEKKFVKISFITHSKGGDELTFGVYRYVIKSLFHVDWREPDRAFLYNRSIESIEKYPSDFRQLSQFFELNFVNFKKEQ